jgi:hypothetical protein
LRQHRDEGSKKEHVTSVIAAATISANCVRAPS